MNMQALPELTLPQMLRERARQDAQRVAIRQKDFGIWKPFTWAQYFERACHFGLGLRALGLPDGGHVGVISENRIEWVLTQMGAGLVGAVTVGVYPTSPSSEVAYVVGHADIEIIVCEDQEQTDKVLEALDDLPRLKKIVVMETKGLRSFAPEVRGLIVPFDEVEQLGAQSGKLQDVEAALARQQLDDIGLMIYTSGSTGKPKGAMVSYRNIRGVVPGIVDRLQLSQDTTHLSYLPLCHVAEQMLTTISIKLQETGGLRRALFRKAYAACQPLAEKPRAQWSIGDMFTFTASYWLVFRALQNFIGLREAKVALTGAAPIPPDVVRFFRVLGVPLVEVYGLTESTGMVTGHPLDHVVVGTVGVPTRGVEWRIAKGSDDDLGGEFQIKGEMVFAGYYKNPEATAQSIVNGWLHTGDVVRLQDGQIKIVDRLKDIMITAGGKNLTPSEIENTMKASPYIKECVIVAEGRKFVGALVMLDYETVGKWAEAQRIPFTHFRSLVETPQVRQLIDAEIATGNAKLAQVAQIRKFHMLTKELDHDDGEVTATMKVRRSSIYKTYAAEIEALYR